MRALLFDLDGTLTRSGGAGTRALGQALHARPQAVAELRKMRLDGMTDRAIARALLAAEGDQTVPLDQRMRTIHDTDIDAVLARYLDALAGECARNVYVALPGVPELLRRLQVRSDAVLGLCTGNLARGAELKLTSAGLWSSFRFGGYGSDAEPRADIRTGGVLRGVFSVSVTGVGRHQASAASNAATSLREAQPSLARMFCT